MLTAENVLIALKVAVVAVTFLLAGSLIALARGRYRLHGRINLAFFALTITALLALEVVVRLIEPTIFDEHFTRTDSWGALYVHLAFSLPAAVVLVLMLWSGLKRARRVHVPLGIVFLVLWVGTFVTGVFFLPISHP